MRIGVNPFTSAAHKEAVRSLYRHLLRAIHSFPDATLTTSLATLVRHRFTKDAHIQSPFTIVDALRQGRNCHALLQRAARDDGHVALTELQTLLRRVQARQEAIRNTQAALAAERRPPAKHKLRKMEHIQRSALKVLQTRQADSTPVLERPAPLDRLPDPETARVKGRIVPKFMVNLGVPFLRYGSSRRQRPVLGRVIRQLAVRDSRQWEVLLDLEAQMGYAAWEDEWDILVHEHCGVRDEIEAEHNEWEEELQREILLVKGREVRSNRNVLYRAQSWGTEVEKQIAQGKMMIRETAEKRLDMGEKLFEVMVGERELAEKEKRERKVRRRQAMNETSS